MAYSLYFLLKVLLEFAEAMAFADDSAFRIEEEEMWDAGDGEFCAEDAVEVEDLVVVNAHFRHGGE